MKSLLLVWLLIPCILLLLALALQLQASLITARRQLDELGQAGQQQEQQAGQLQQQVAALRAERAAAAEEAHSAQQELQRVLRELDQCQKVRCGPIKNGMSCGRLPVVAPPATCHVADSCSACCLHHQLAGEYILYLNALC